MKKFPVHKNISRTPTLFGLPMQAGGVFFGVSVVNAIVFIFLPVGPLLKLGGIATLPIIIYVSMILFFTRFSFESFAKSMGSVKIRAIKNKNLSTFKDGIKD